MIGEQAMENAEKITVLIVDDSPVQRALLRTTLGDEADITVVSHAVNGRLALPRVRHFRPEVIVLDQEMPEMNGLETLRVLRQEFPDTAVIMYCSPTTESARVTMQALQLGAADFVTKPSANGSEKAHHYIRSVLVPRIRALQRREIPLRGPAQAPAAFSGGAFDICAIGISTGGPQILREMFSGLDRLSGSVVVAQHMPAGFTGQLAATLNEVSGLQVREVLERTRLEPGCAYVAPGGAHMEIVREGESYFAVLNDGPPELNCKPSVNVLFRSVAKCAGRRAVGVIMTGMGYDGYEGMRTMREAGCHLIAQSAASCLVYGMPARPTEEGIVHEVLDPAGIVNRIKEAMP